MERMNRPDKEPSAKHLENLHWNLFKSTFLISAFTVGGGYVIIPLMKTKFVDEYKWLDDKEALNLVAIAQASPGVVAINMAVVLGYRLAGWSGLFTTLLATILPPLLMLTLIAYFYQAFISNMYIKWALKGMQIAATAVILEVAVKLLNGIWKKKEYTALVIAAVSFIASYFFNVNIMYIVLLCAVYGLLFMRGEDTKG